jgi:hypothetical protein
MGGGKKKHFHEGSAELQIPRFARDDKKERVVRGKGPLLKERAVAKGKGSC